MTTPSCSGSFQTLLDQLRDFHVKEVDALRAEVTRLRAKCIAFDGPPESDTLDLEVTVDGDTASKPCDCSKQDVAAPFPKIRLERQYSNFSESLVAGFDASRAVRAQTLEIARAPPRSRVMLHLKGIVSKPWFESFFSALIVVNALVMGAEAQYRGLDLCLDLRYRWCEKSASNSWPGAADTFLVLGWVFGILFALEVVIKFICVQSSFCRDYWNALDFIVVIAWLVESIGRDVLPINPQVVRLARLTRLLRLVRLGRALEGMDSLYLMMTAIRGSFSVLCWSVVLLAVIQITFALFLNQWLHQIYFTDDFYEVEERQEVYEYFGTFSRALFSMFELTLANWPTVCRVLAENVTEWFMLFCVIHKLTIGFAVLGIINGALMQETFKVASTDDTIMVRQKRRAARVHADKMGRLFNEADENGNGMVTLEEFRTVIKDSIVETWLASMDLDMRDSDTLFMLIDEDGDGEITVEELIQGVARLKGPARSIDLNIMKIQQQKLSEMIEASAGAALSASSKFGL